jgi:nucleotide-binding universal stress UspA family protein
MFDSKRILVAFDGSPQAEQAFDFALEMSKDCQGMTREITVLSVVHLMEQIDVPVDIESIVNAAKAQYESLLIGLQEKAKSQGLNIAVEIVTGHPADDIIEYAAKNKINLIIMGQRGKSKVSKWLLGSVSLQVASHAPCSVMIVK